LKNAPNGDNDQPEGDPAGEPSIVEELPQKRATFIFFHAVSLNALCGNRDSLTPPRPHDRAQADGE
jgi:hypothetical protein